MPLTKIRALLLGLTIAGMLSAGCDINPVAPTPIPAVLSATPAAGTPFSTTRPAAATPAARRASATPVPTPGTATPPTSPTAATPAPLLPAPTETSEPLVTLQFDVTLPADTPLTGTVYVSGNFQGTLPRAVALARQGNHAAGRVSAGAGRDLTYQFTRGSLATVEKAADCTTAPDRHVPATAGRIITATVAAWADGCVAIYDTRAQRISLPSQALGISKDFYIYTPPGYAQATGARYPVLYLFRGHEREWINKYEDSSREGRNVIDVYESLLAAKQVGPLILVFPGISSSDDTIPGLLTNFRAPQLAGVDGIGSGRFEDYFIRDLVPYVDSHYRTVATREGRGVDGFSLGGFMSTKIAAQHPDLFRTVGAFDGLYFYADSTCHGIDTARESLLTLVMFWPVFGNPPDLAFAAANNPPNLICRGPRQAIQDLHWFIQYGPESAEPNNSNYYRGVHLLQQLERNGVQDGSAPILTGGHRWATADAHMRLTLPLHWAILGRAARP